MVTRAIHLELVQDGSAESFMHAFRRFVARRSCPRLVISDNAAIFTASAIKLNVICKKEAVLNALSNLNVEWKFIPARAPHFGGVWERMVGLTKTTLKKILGRSLLSSVELGTVLCEVECLINDRPLTYLTDGTDDETITPSHLLSGRRLRSLAEAAVDLEEFTDPSIYIRPVFTYREKRMRLLLSHFWRRWRNDYLKSLRETDRNLVHGESSKVCVGDVVLIKDERSRCLWNLGKVITLHNSNDGVTRSVTLKTRNGNITRPIIKLVPLEISDCAPLLDITAKSVAPASARPKRVASARPRQLIAGTS
jgi:hypothetical protein